MPSVVQPPMASTMSQGHSTALRRSLRLCRKEWMTHPSGSRGGLNFLMWGKMCDSNLNFEIAFILWMGKKCFFESGLPDVEPHQIKSNNVKSHGWAQVALIYPRHSVSPDATFVQPHSGTDRWDQKGCNTVKREHSLCQHPSYIRITIRMKFRQDQSLNWKSSI